MTESWSTDGGASWSPMRCTRLANPNAGDDAVMLVDGRQLLDYNPSRRLRTPLTGAVSGDGQYWRDVLVRETGGGEYSYPAVIQGSDTRILVTYRWNRSAVAHVVPDPYRLGGKLDRGSRSEGSAPTKAMERESGGPP